jgi:tetratricopeptide (TPR) repeat protein
MYVLFGLLIAVWLATLIECWLNEPDWSMWLLLLVVFNIGAIPVYIVLRVLPRYDILPRSYWERRFRHREIAQAEAAAHGIGNPHQWFQLGEVYRQVGMLDEAADALGTALKKDSDHMPARWAAALTEMERKRPAAAREHLARIVERDPNYKFGEAYLAYGETLVKLNELDLARTHLETDLKRFARPEARLMLADICHRQGDASAARTHVYTLIGELKGSPDFARQRHGQLLAEAQRLLKEIGRG